jgi:nucleoside-diphosphate-sugar epimerase
MASIIVTGGSGFLGHHLCRALIAAGHTVKNIDLRPNPEVPTVIADICDKDRMMAEIKDADVVFHLAALIEAGESVKYPQRFVDVNISGTINILEAMRTNGVNTFIFSSSAAVYGEPQHPPLHEDDRTIPINPYGMTKLAMEGLVSSYASSFQMTGIGLRYFNLYGPEEHHQPESHAIPRFIEQIRTGQEVTVWGGGEHQRDFIYISDVVDGHLKAMELAQREPQKYHYFNLSTGQPSSVKQITEKLENLIGKKANIHNYPNRPGDPLVLVADPSKARQILGWEAKVLIDEGLKKTWEYFSTLPEPTSK